MLRRQLWVLIGAGLVMSAIIAGTTVWAFVQFSALRDDGRISTEMNDGLNDLQYLATEYLATRTPRTLKQWDSRHARLSKFLETTTIADDQVRRMLPEIRNRFHTLGSVFAKLISADRADLTPERAAAAERAIVTRLLNQILALSTLKKQIAEIYRRREDRLLEYVPPALSGIFLFGLVAMIAVYARVMRRTSKDMRTLSDAIMALGSGDIDEPVAVPARTAFAPQFEALEQSRKRVAEATHQMQQERADLDHFVYVASHDFKAPLRGIDNLATWIDEDSGPQLNGEAREHLDMLRRRVKRLETLLEDLLTYSRAGRIKVPLENVDVGRLLRDIVSDLNPRPGMRVEIGADMPVLYSPKAPLEHIFYNLIGNAVKHHDRDKGTIVVTASSIRDGYRFRVSDDGPGIPARFRDRIFEMFQTLKPRDEVEGSGMGLAIAKRLVQSYDGEITVSGGDGRGAAFEFTWFPTGKEKDADVSEKDQNCFPAPR